MFGHRRERSRRGTASRPAGNRPARRPGPPSPVQSSSEARRLMFSFVSRLVIRHPWLIALAWLFLAAVLHHFSPPWDQVTKDDNVRFFPPDFPSVVGQELLERGFPQDASSSQVVLVYERRPLTPDQALGMEVLAPAPAAANPSQGGRLTTEDFRYVEGVAARFYQFARSHPELGFKKLDTHRSPVIGPRLIGTSADGRGQAVLTIISLNGTYLAKTTRIAVDRIMDWLKRDRPAPPAGLELALTGSAVVGHDINTAANESISNTTRATVSLVVLILLVVYRSPLLAMVPLITIALSVVVSLWSIALLATTPGFGFQVISITKVFVIVVLFGAGTDYCLFLIARYSEELGRGRAKVEALGEAIRQVGGALVASAGTVIIGLGMLYFSSFAKIKYTGPTIALSLAVALAASLSLAPALLGWLGDAIFWPFRAPRQTSRGDRESESPDSLPATGFWVRVADLVVHYPLGILSICLMVLTPLAAVGARTHSNYNQLADLDPDRPSVIGANIVRRYFAPGELSPTTALIDNPGLDFRSERGQAAIEATSRRLLALDNVAEVRSLTRPVGKPLAADSGQRLFSRVAGEALLRLGAAVRY